MYGWAGSILHADLSNKKIWKEPLSVEQAFKYLGGRGLNAKTLWNLAGERDLEPFSPDNVLIFGTGTLSGTFAPSSGRTTITTKSPLTGLYAKSSFGGQFGPQLKFAGYDQLLVHGRSSEPCYLSIMDHDVQIKDARHLWGLDVRETDEALKAESSRETFEACYIGPAGERLVRFASIMTSVYHAAARAGVGAVMGAKNLKAVAVSGTGSMGVAHPQEFEELVLRVREELSNDEKAGRSLHTYGTAGGLLAANEDGSLPARNFSVSSVSDGYPLSGQCLVERGYLTNRVGCFACTISCHRYTTVKRGRYAGTSTGGPEFENMASLGAGPEVLDTESVLRANELCNIYGLDTISTGVVIQWAMECYEKDILTKSDTEGLELRFGSSEALLSLIAKIAYREGKLCNLLAEGIRRAAEKIGHDSWKWAICNSKGMEQSGVDTRAAKAYALSFAVNPRGPDHLHTECLAEYGGSPGALALIRKLTGDEKWATPYSTEYRAEIVRWHEDCYAVSDALGFCVFTNTSAYAVNPENMAAMFSAATGCAIDESTIMKAGRRIVTLERCYNAQLGADRKMDDLPWRLMNEPSPRGIAKGMINSKQELDKMLDEYYRLHNWDIKTGLPTKHTLALLDLAEVAEKLERVGCLPPVPG
ncbi:MAG: aldehyde ferredoxin oxidoreductase family protein [Candidatus Bathyarchaeia archaeon]|jgi:aldehyde:ferredoxin oxidoreductase